MVLDIGEIGYLGIDYTQQYDSMARLLRGVKKDLPVFEGAWLNALGHQARTGFLRAACYKQIGIPGSAYRKSLADYFRKHEVQCMLAYWGTNPIADAISIKKYRPETRIILNILCHPIGVTPLKIRLQNWILQRSLKYFDGLIYPGTVMKRYFEREVKGAAEMPSLVLAPLLPRFSEAVEGPGPERAGAQRSVHGAYGLVGRANDR
jgi:hypothetical protein